MEDSICISQVLQTKQNVYIYIEKEGESRRVFVGIGSHSCGNQSVVFPRRPETREEFMLQFESEDSLEADFRQVTLVFFFLLRISNYCMRPTYTIESNLL